MNAPSASKNANIFPRITSLVLLLIGFGIFIVLLYALGSDKAFSTNDGNAHANGKGLNGYAAFYRLTEERYQNVQRLHRPANIDDTFLLVITPSTYNAESEIQKMVAKHRKHGPVLLIAPKWFISVIPPARQTGKGHSGWVDIHSPHIANFAYSIKGFDKIDHGNEKTGSWHAASYPTLRGPLPKASATLVLKNEDFRPLVWDEHENVLAATATEDNLYPLLIVADPDLLNNYGMANEANAHLAIWMLDLLMADVGQVEPYAPIRFDMTLAGFTSSSNLLNLAFTPPFLAATICLLMAALVIIWQGFLSFGPKRQAARALAFGKSSLVYNTADLILQTERRNLMGTPYIEGVRERLIRALALPRYTSTEATDMALDRALEARNPASPSFTATTARIEAARNSYDLLKAAQDLHATERMLTQ